MLKLYSERRKKGKCWPDVDMSDEDDRDVTVADRIRSERRRQTKNTCPESFPQSTVIITPFLQSTRGSFTGLPR